MFYSLGKLSAFVFNVHDSNTEWSEKKNEKNIKEKEGKKAIYVIYTAL